jgi:hypothetical protein
LLRRQNLRLLLRFCFRFFLSCPERGIVGSVGVVAVGPYALGCIAIGPVLSNDGCFLGIAVNERWSFSFVPGLR